MEYRVLPHGGEKLSVIGMGASVIGAQPQEEIIATVRAAMESGINLFDMAGGHATIFEAYGKAFAGRRDQVYLQVHFGANYTTGEYGWTTNPEEIRKSVAWQLEKLQTDYIDFGFIHCIDEQSDLEAYVQKGVLELILELKKRGVIRHIGLSTHNPAVAKLAALSGEIEMILFSVNPAFDMLPATEDIQNYFAENYDDSLSGIAPERVELYQLCEQQDVGITVMKGYAGGRLFNPQSSPFGVALTPVQCIHYALTRPAVASVLVGYDTVAHVDAAVAYETASDAEKDYASVLAHAPRHAASGQCTYCGHCAPCPSGIDIAMVNKLYDLATMQPSVPPTVQAHYDALSSHAADCIACGGCEKRCPFGVPVTERMAKAAALLGR